ncbi:MAG: diaminopimelate decarboxylase [Deltaproteobacteria bacterium]|nr:diaminopimelate decarboxylase [Deltaproteobacteria bacterium]
MDLFEYKNNELYCEDVPLASIAQAIGTPCYVYSSTTFKQHLEDLEQAWEGTPHLTCYSVKVASNLALLKIVAARNLGADIVSGGELFRALKAGIEPSKIVYSGVGKTASEMAEALEASILMFNVESAAELELLAKIAADKNLTAPISLRVNPDVDPKTHPYVATGLKESKFGVPAAEALELYSLASQTPSLRPVGLDCHIGSQLVSVEPFREAASILKDLILRLRQSSIPITFLDLGGGLGINYFQEKPPTPAQYAGALKEVLSGMPDLTVITEPGRVVAGNSAVLLTKVLYLKQTQAKSFVIIDGALNDLIRPSLYGSYHAIGLVKSNDGPLSPVDVVGPVCESGDFLAKDRPLPPVAAGEFLAVRSAGAYGFSMSSNYNSRPRAAEVLVSGNSFEVIRNRESYQDLIRGE